MNNTTYGESDGVPGTGTPRVRETPKATGEEEVTHNVSQSFNEANHLKPEKDGFWQMSAGKKSLEQPLKLKKESFSIGTWNV